MLGNRYWVLVGAQRNLSATGLWDMMKLYFIYMAYVGSAYHGWQVQPGEITVQSVVEDALSTILHNPTAVTGAGRTDAGVHARFYVAHFDSEKENLSNDNKLLYRLNSYLPKDISVNEIREVNNDAHARFSAVLRSYMYYITSKKDPFLRQYSWNRYGEMDIDRMNQAASYMKNYEDFTSFSRLHSDVKTNKCKISEAYWIEENYQYIFNISADRFLRNMVRSIVGTMELIGSGRIDPEAIRGIIEAKDRSYAGKSVPPEGLFLTDIKYPDGIFS